MNTCSSNADIAYADNYISLNDFVVNFTPEVTKFFIERIGEDEFMSICRKSCQAPPYTSIRIDLLKISREDALTKVEEILSPFNNQLISENRSPIKPYLHSSIEELIIIPSAPSICPSIDVLKSYPMVLIDRMCAESVLRGSDIFMKGVRSVDKNALKDQKVCLAVDLCNCDLPRGSDTTLFTGRNVIIGEGILRVNRNEVFSLESGLCIDSIHRVSFDLPPLQELPSVLLMQNYPSLLTSLILHPEENDVVLDCCAAPGNKWSHLAMLMKDSGIIIGIDRSLKKAVSNLHAIKEKYQYKNMQIRYVDMTKGVLSIQDEERLREEKGEFVIEKIEQQIVSPKQSKSFRKKMVRIQREKERKEREKRKKNGEDISLDVSTIEVTEEQANQLLLKYSESKKNQQKLKRNKDELLLLDDNIANCTPEILKNLLLAGIHAGTARVSGFPREVFHRVLLDPPCSALGLRPRLSHTVTMEELYGYRSYQRQFIEVAIQLLAVGGELVYSTCTYDPLENEENVAFILNHYPMELMDAKQVYHDGKDGLLNCGLSEEQCKKVQRFNMTEECDSIGFFISKFRKIGEYKPNVFHIC